MYIYVVFPPQLDGAEMYIHVVFPPRTIDQNAKFFDLRPENIVKKWENVAVDHFFEIFRNTPKAEVSVVIRSMSEPRICAKKRQNWRNKVVSY
jgi:hypothetical protein